MNEIVYERFTDRAKRVLQLASLEAQRFNHENIGTEHLLLGLLKQKDASAVHVLKNLGVDVLQIHQEVERRIGHGPSEMCTMGKLPQTPRVKKIIENAIIEARDFGHSYVGTEHLLLGLLRTEDGIAWDIFRSLGLTLEGARNAVTLHLGGDEIQLLQDGVFFLQRKDSAFNPQGALVELFLSLAKQLDISSVIVMGKRKSPLS